MKRKRKQPEPPPQSTGLSEGEAEFNRWMDQVDLEALDLERLARQAADADAEGPAAED